MSAAVYFARKRLCAACSQRGTNGRFGATDVRRQFDLLTRKIVGICKSLVSKAQPLGIRTDNLRVRLGTRTNESNGVTGISQALKQALDCASWMGRISLLGCTRVSDCSIDFYKQVHRPGIKLIGAHNFVRPKYESYPHHRTHNDDRNAILDMIASKRIQAEPIISRVESSEDAPQIYNELCDDKNFPLGTVFD